MIGFIIGSCFYHFLCAEFKKKGIYVIANLWEKKFFTWLNVIRYKILI